MDHPTETGKGRDIKSAEIHEYIHNYVKNYAY